MHVKSLQSCPTLCDPMNCSLPVSYAHEILQARILEWVAIPHTLLQTIFPTQGSNPCVLLCGPIHYHLSHQVDTVRIGLTCRTPSQCPESCLLAVWGNHLLHPCPIPWLPTPNCHLVGSTQNNQTKKMFLFHIHGPHTFWITLLPLSSAHHLLWAWRCPFLAAATCQADRPSMPGAFSLSLYFQIWKSSSLDLGSGTPQSAPEEVGMQRSCMIQYANDDDGIER